MEDIKIPHAEKAYVDRSLSPREFLHVVTKLPEHSPSGADADARHEMLKAIAAEVEARGLDFYRVYWSDSDDAHRS